MKLLIAAGLGVFIGAASLVGTSGPASAHYYRHGYHHGMRYHGHYWYGHRYYGHWYARGYHWRHRQWRCYHYGRCRYAYW